MSNLSQFMPPGYVEWQAVQTSSFTAGSAKAYPINTSGNAVTATLPASPSSGDTVVFLDYARSFATNNLTVNRNGQKMQGGTIDAKFNKDGTSITYVYVDSTKGWIPQIEETTTTDQSLPAGQQEYTSSGSHTWTVPSGVTQCSVVVVGAGGRSGIGNSGQAAGGGALAYRNNIAVTAGQTASITVGAPGNHSGYQGNSGGASSFTYGGTSTTANGGGGGYGNQDSSGSPGNGGTISGTTTGGGSGGNGGQDQNNWGGPGGGGAGGYTGNGGNGASTTGDGSNANQGSGGSGGGGGGGGKGGQSEMGGGGGGGVGIKGQDTSGGGGGGQPQNAIGGSGGGGGSNGQEGGQGQSLHGGQGGNYGGGHGGSQSSGTANTGGVGAVRIIWGPNRTFPNNAGDI